MAELEGKVFQHVASAHGVLPMEQPSAMGATRGTNNSAELTALCWVLAWALQAPYCHSLTVHVDNTMAPEVMSGTQACVQHPRLTALLLGIPTRYS